MNDIQTRMIAALASILAAWAVQHLGIDQHSADIVSTALITGGCGWATKFITDWGTKRVPKDAVVTPAKVELPPEPPRQSPGSSAHG